MAEVLDDLVEQRTQHATKNTDEDEKDVIQHVVVGTKFTRRLFKFYARVTLVGKMKSPHHPVRHETWFWEEKGKKESMRDERERERTDNFKNKKKDQENA